MPKYSHSKRISMYSSAKDVDSAVFAEMKSNCRLVAGDHYLKSVHRDVERLKLSKSIASDIKIRLTQNHIARASNFWVNAILNAAPDVQILPRNKYEEGDKKAAELNASVKAYVDDQNEIEEVKYKLCRDFFDTGEAHVKCFYDPEVGPLVDGDYIELRNPETGEVVDFYQEQFPMGMTKIERIIPFNLLRDPAATERNNIRWHIYRKMMDKQELLSMIPQEDEEKRKAVQESSEETMQVYDNFSNTYRESKKVLVLEMYIKPNRIYPKGYFYIFTMMGDLFEGELPGGIYPIISVTFDEVSGSPRGVSRIKQLRPIQGEINRSISKMAEHQVTLGDDKLILRAGGKLVESNKIGGIRALQISGGGLEPTILPGRAGDQFLNYWTTQVQMFDRIAELPEIDQDKANAQDPYALMLFSMRQKKRYSLYAEKFERFLKNLTGTALRITKHHIPNASLIPMVGRHETVNIDEFKSTDDISFQIMLKPRTDDPVGLVAEQFQINQILQYAGANLDPIDIGEIISDLPFLRNKSVVSRGKSLSDRARNMILKLDKGVDVRVSEKDDAAYMLNRLDSRMIESDFDFITAKTPDGQQIPNEYIQQLYEQKRQEYLALEQQMLQAKQMYEAGQIPTTGELVPVQLYTSKETADGGMTISREYMPHDSLIWLRDALIQRGMTESSLKGFSPSTQAELQAGLAQAPDQMGQNNY